MNIKEYQKIVDQWIKTVGVKYFKELTNMAILTEEVGELARLMSRVYGEQSFKQYTSDEDAKAMITDELADILWVVTCLANQMDIDLTKAIDKNLEKKNIRDKGRHQNNPKLL